MIGGAIGQGMLVGTLAAPLILLVACLSGRLRRHALALAPFAPLPGLAAALLAIGGPPLTFALPALRLGLLLDAPGAMLLAVAALLWIGGGVYAFRDLRGKPKAELFAVGWLLTLTGSLGVFIAADLLTFYFVYALVSIPAFVLVAHDDDAAAARAGGVYMAFTVLGETFLLMGFVLLAAGEPSGSLAIRDVMAALPGSPWRDAALTLTVLGFGLKIALVPMHGWMPLAYSAAPIPAAAVLSGAAVKAGVIGLIRFLPLGAALPGWGETLAAIGLFSAFYGVAIGVTQQNPKTVLAYSSISQMGVIAAVLGMGLAAGDRSAALDAAFYGAHHVIVKGALFLAVGVAAASSRRRLWLALAPALVLALSLGGLPLTGGALAKLAVKTQLGGGPVGALAAFSAAGTTLLMLHFLRRLAGAASQDAEAAAPAGLIAPWLAMALAAVLVPWLLYPRMGGHIADALTPYALWEGLWPVLIGAALALLLQRWGDRLPRPPAGDIIGIGEDAFRKSFVIGAALERADGEIRQWPAAAVSLLVLAIVFGAAMMIRL
ncbi:NADH/ubiquinone/plastoquinone (Complex I) [Methylocella tundrae]|uniref:NADH/ubiquinone/plastoquinone (Complex I) n=1 Tax=Methylocella tundrae TaxID=227605 RepID=A0A8B6M789_METTU|nr:proton-conducting transporter membrane subunit [Methylocella tundrae]VTZ50899.1 NADH/ubiquinone/plastoquinone (Complex I) [Methylocella tundrae]